MRIVAAIFVAALSVGAVPIPELLAVFNAGDLRPDSLPIPEGVIVTKGFNPSNGVPVVQVSTAVDGPVWVPLFRLPDGEIDRGEIRYRMTFVTELPANHVQPSLQIEYASGDEAVTASQKNFAELKEAAPPSFTSEGRYWNDRSDAEAAVMGVTVHGPGTVNIEQAHVMGHQEPFRGFTAETILLMGGLSGVCLIFALGFLRIQPSAARARRLPIRSMIRCGFAAVFVLGFFVLPQWESNWTIPFILCGAFGFLVADLPFLRQSDEHV